MRKSKKIFFIGLTMFSILVAAIIALSIIGTLADYKAANGDISAIIPIFIILPIVFLLVFGFMYNVGNFVFKDSQKKGMDPWLWTSMALFIPNFIGLIIYLIVRNTNNKKICNKCGRPVDEEFISCPFCGNKLKESCASCGATVELNWNICSKCGVNLK